MRSRKKGETVGREASAVNGHGTARKKTLVLDQDLLDRARQLLGLRTETETVTRALETVVLRERQILGLRALAELGPIDAGRIGK